jgi:predicted phage terminase large subunit-like protein
MDKHEALLESVRIAQHMLKKKWLSSLYSFNTQCLMVEDGKNKVALSAFHKELCDFVDANKNKQKLLLVPRGHLKSTLVTIGKTVQWIVENPAVRILIANATYQMAIAFLSVIKRHITQNKQLLEIFGEVAKNPEKWAENMITLEQANVHGGEKEATVFCYGMSGNLVSQHYDKIILDDVVNDDNVNTRDRIEKTLQFYRFCQPLLEKDGEMIIIGTRYHEDDLYGHILNRENGLRDDFVVFERRAIDGELWDQKEQKFVRGNVLWKEKYDLSNLSDIRRKMGPWVFSSQYLNDPVPPSDATFKREWFSHYEVADLKGFDLNRYVLIDPAISTEQEADYTAMVVVGIDVYKNIYILDIARDRMKPDGIIDNIFYLNERWHPTAIGLEEVAFQRTLRYSLKMEMEKRKKYFNIVELKPHGRNKEIRIKALQPLYASGKVLHNRDLVYNIYLEDELLRFPRGKHDDIIDALAYALDIVTPPAVKVSRWKAKKYLY